MESFERINQRNPEFKNHFQLKLIGAVSAEVLQAIKNSS